MLTTVAQSSPVHIDLYQIRQGYRTRWYDLTFVVEASLQQWTLRVEDSKQTLYLAHRATAAGAQAAAAEFGIFQLFGACTREAAAKLASSLIWTEYW